MSGGGESMPEAFVLFKTLPARERDVYQTLTDHSAVVEVHALYGEYDLLVRVSSEDARKLLSLIHISEPTRP